MEFRRIQFTPDLMPSDITGMDIIEEDPATGRRKLEFLPGPIFTNFLLADEINRTPPKTQAALLQAMQEGEVSIGRRTYPLKPPFFVVATQNPIEMEGTYPLARGAARPVHVQPQGHVPDDRRGAPDRQGDDRHASGRGAAGAPDRGGDPAPGAGPRSADRRRR